MKSGRLTCRPERRRSPRRRSRLQLRPSSHRSSRRRTGREPLPRYWCCTNTSRSEPRRSDGTPTLLNPERTASATERTALTRLNERGDYARRTRAVDAGSTRGEIYHEGASLRPVKPFCDLLAPGFLVPPLPRRRSRQHASRPWLRWIRSSCVGRPENVTAAVVAATSCTPRACRRAPPAVRSASCRGSLCSVGRWCRPTCRRRSRACRYARAGAGR